MAEGDGNGRSYEHLKPYQWRPGQSGNPAGRPKKKSFLEVLRDVLQEDLQITEGPLAGKSIPKLEMVARILVDELLKRNTRLITEFLDREWPKTHHLSLTSDDGTVSVEIDTGPERLEEVAEILDEVTRH